ncbi:MAG: 4-hydroxythreonine-4-phosphate dehydrogenase PdxA [Eubacteriales bacterium]|nr:4-hydroxythreonine-4-phosphate dehydrogenase PdxA [Eubacteriales bacterium]
MIERPILGISMGDPFGNGPEITVKALNDQSVYERCRPLVVGDKSSMEYALAVAKKLNGIDLKLNCVNTPAEARYVYGTIDLLDLGLVSVDEIPQTINEEQAQPFGIGASKLGGEASFQYIVKVIELAMSGQIHATVTNAISKEAINMAGHHYSGHTEIYAHYTHTDKYAMMLAHEDLRVVHVSTHVSLREACDRVKKQRVLDCIHMAHEAMKDIGIENPKIGVAGLNPHCGEEGMFGREEIEEIQPAIDEALKEGINIPDKKPTPPDTVFSKALGAWYDIVVVMYHDQGHIPLKIKGFVYNKEEQHWEAVAGINVTLGLPIIRASVDHGTGFGHAGSGQANELSLVNAMDYAILLGAHKG